MRGKRLRKAMYEEDWMSRRERFLCGATILPVMLLVGVITTICG
jgi:hypothetical protein